MRRLHPALICTGVLLLVGCSISESVKSSFESSASSSASSSGSSSKESESYRNEVRDYTSAYVKSGGQFENFTSGLSSIAQRHNITNWEEDKDTFVGIGAGLRAGSVTPEQFKVWQSNLSNGDSTKAAWMQSGYDQSR